MGGRKKHISRKHIQGTRVRGVNYVEGGGRRSWAFSLFVKGEKGSNGCVVCGSSWKRVLPVQDALLMKRRDLDLDVLIILVGHWEAWQLYLKSF